MKKFGIGIVLVLLLLGACSFYIYKSIWGPNVTKELEDPFLYILPQTEFNELSQQLIENNIILNKTSFDLVSKLMKFDKGIVKDGKFKLQANWSNRQLISRLRSGKQEPVKLTFNNLRTIEEFAGRLSQQLYLDSIDILKHLSSNKNHLEWDTDSNTVLSLFIADTYEVYWNTSVEDLIDKLIDYGKDFWQKNDRRKKLTQLNLTINEAYTLASIVHKETIKNDEKDRIAGVYINRLYRDMPLQADPTVVFALKQFDLKRILNKHLEIDSPFNTYKYAGLPPGPICMPDKSTIDAVLNYEKHKFLYFCAKPDYSGYHNFARNLIEHNAYARKYHRWLNQQKIK